MRNQSIKILKDILKSALGLFFYSCGVYLTLRADIGIAPWECLSMSISSKIGISFGTIHMLIGILILFLDLSLKEKIGFGTVLDALLVGNYVDWITYFDPVLVSRSFPLSILMIVVGLFIMGYGQYFYMSAGLSCGPRDSLLLALGKQFSLAPIGIVQTCIIGSVLLVSALLDGPIGIGTILSVFFAGIALQIVCRLKRFDPRDVVHKSITETVQSLFQNKPEVLK
ncbi:YczE/YyaS/YitT family protein [Anaerotignum sp.]